MVNWLLAGICVCGLLFLGESTKSASDYGIKNGRLPPNLLPHDYYLTLKPDFQNYQIQGTVEIHFKVIEKTNIVVLNSVDIIALKINLMTPNRDQFSSGFHFLFVFVFIFIFIFFFVKNFAFLFFKNSCVVTPRR